jgi:hypothetical protein
VFVKEMNFLPRLAIGFYWSQLHALSEYFVYDKQYRLVCGDVYSFSDIFSSSCISDPPALKVPS